MFKQVMASIELNDNVSRFERDRDSRESYMCLFNSQRDHVGIELQVAACPHCRAVPERHLDTLASVSPVSHEIYCKELRGL